MLVWVEPGPLPFPLGPCPPVLPQLQEELEQPGPSPVRYRVSWSQLLLMPVALEMTLLLFLFGSVWVQTVSPENITTSPMSESSTLSGSSTSNIHETTTFTSMTSHLTKVVDSTVHPTFPPSSTSAPASEFLSTLGTSPAASSDLAAPRLISSQELMTKNSSVLPEISEATSVPAHPVMDSSESHTVTDTIMATSSLETFSGTRGPSLITATSSLETSSGTRGPSVTTATSSLETSSGTREPITTATSSLETSSGTRGLSVTTAIIFLKPSMGTRGSTIFGEKIVTISSTSFPKLHPGTNVTLLVSVLLVALLVIIVLLCLLLLCVRWKKQRTGVLTLSRGGKRNGAGDAWAGRAQVSDEEAMIKTDGVSRGDKGSGVPQGEGSDQRSTLTTFLNTQKSHQDSLPLEDLKAQSASSLNGEKEPLVGREDGAVEASVPDGPEARDVKAP
ncbi:Leukosialin [Camelus dromedarius]|uniref:Leukosialin n=2 Tax=Camelus dromedarius TaxID=9838 RepID=A0A5N4CXM0_CAMDR|nr:Leukosialin [Camelus dromedarius]